MKRMLALRMVATVLRFAVMRADLVVSAAYMFVPMFGIGHASMQALRFGRAWWAVLERELDVACVAIGWAG